MVTLLRLNGRRLAATVEEAERTILQVASGALGRAGLEAWVAAHEASA
jgi:prophage maintenance system killer protein